MMRTILERISTSKQRIALTTPSKPKSPKGFDFLPQAGSVAALLRACEASLPHVPSAIHDSLVAALKPFEERSAPTTWWVDDVLDRASQTTAHGLTGAEAANALSNFARKYGAREQDWDELDFYIASEISEREPHVKFDYDPAYTGGDYSGMSYQTVLIPESWIDAAQVELDRLGTPCATDEAFALAFRKVTKLDSMHIVAYSADERYNKYGELLVDGMDNESTSRLAEEPF
jgi:hypothetical protein